MELRPDIDAALARATRDPRLMRAALALHQNRLSEAEPLLRAHLYEKPFDFAAIRMLAELAARIGRVKDSETLLRRALEIAPRFGPARANLATLLYRENRPAEALAALDALDLNADSSSNLRAAVLNRLGEFEAALAIYTDTLARHPDQPGIWMSYGHVLKTVGRLADGVEAYRHAIDLVPHYGEAWWSLANLKTVKFTPADIDRMTQQLARADLKVEDHFHLEFALGKAWEDAGDATRAFAYYEAANARHRDVTPYQAKRTTKRVDAAIESFTPDFFAARAGQGSPSPGSTPIFIVGMPRAGSTLLEQILASHSLVEGINELPDIPQLWASLGNDPHAQLATLGPAELRALGENYLGRVAVQRKTDRPYFIDKLPNNWLHVGFIKAILPDAKFVDARRHPMSCGFSNFKQHYARGHAFSYSLEDIGHYYADYVRLMRHFDATMPDMVYRVIYEQMVEDSETQIQALLDALGLPFEQACLNFHETERAVRTPSSEQVRSPIFRSGTEAWQAFAPWLDPLCTTLGPLLQSYAL